MLTEFSQFISSNFFEVAPNLVEAQDAPTSRAGSALLGSQFLTMI
jgi:hypothetical protein